MAIVIDDIRLSDDVERGSRGGPQFNTTILEGANFAEDAIQNWAVERLRWDISYGIDNKASYRAILDFFRGRRGAARGFLFKDWSMYAMPRQTIGTGDGAEDVFNLDYTIPDTILPTIRRITHPTDTTASNLFVWVDSVLQTITTHFTITNGVITFVTPPPNTHLVEAEVIEFLIPVRFDEDQMVVEMLWEGAGSIPEIPIVEITSL